jgi:tetratricopeptide (TPR) repeat protein
LPDALVSSLASKIGNVARSKAITVSVIPGGKFYGRARTIPASIAYIGHMRTGLMLFVALAAVSLSAQTPLVDQGRAALNRGDADAAADLLEKAVAQWPNSAEAHYYLGSAYGAKAQKANPFSAASLAGKTREEFEKAVALNPKWIEARLGLAEFYIFAPGIIGGSFDKALAQAAEMKTLDPLQAHRVTAMVYSAQKKPELAKKEYLDAIQERPNNPKPHQYLGQFLANTEKNYPAAFSELETAVKLDPSYMPPLFQIGRTAAASATNLARGEEALKRYLTTTPKDGEPPLANAHYWLGAIYEKQNRKPDAKREYETALKMNPGLQMATDALKRVS